MAALESNPLPHTLVVRPRKTVDDSTLEVLGAEVRKAPGVDLVKLDLKWVERLNAVLDFLRRLGLMIGGLLIAAVVIVVGNTIRLDIQNRRQEIEVSKLLGATDAFVRRPFLYTGFWYGLLGGSVALLVLGAGLLLVSGPLGRLLTLYGAEFGGFGLSPATAGLVLGGGLLAGWAGAWAAVARHLSAIQPRV
jgi:cell division transport system permease protein